MKKFIILIGIFIATLVVYNTQAMERKIAEKPLVPERSYSLWIFDENGTISDRIDLQKDRVPNDQIKILINFTECAKQIKGVEEFLFPLYEKNNLTFIDFACKLCSFMKKHQGEGVAIYGNKDDSNTIAMIFCWFIIKTIDDKILNGIDDAGSKDDLSEKIILFASRKIDTQVNYSQEQLAFIRNFCMQSLSSDKRLCYQSRKKDTSSSISSSPSISPGGSPYGKKFSINKICHNKSVGEK